MLRNDDRRKHERHAANGTFLIYKTLSIISYTVDLQNISRSGAFINTKHLPHFGEELHFDILSTDGEKLATGHGKVARLVKEGSLLERGFGVHFTRKLQREIEEPLMVVDSPIHRE